MGEGRGRGRRTRRMKRGRLPRGNCVMEGPLIRRGSMTLRCRRCWTSDSLSRGGDKCLRYRFLRYETTLESVTEQICCHDMLRSLLIPLRAACSVHEIDYLRHITRKAPLSYPDNVLTVSLTFTHSLLILSNFYLIKLTGDVQVHLE